MRVNKQMSQSDLSAKLQVNGVTLERDSISRIERGTRFVADYELYIFAKVFGVEVEELLELKAEQKKGKANEVTLDTIS